VSFNHGVTLPYIHLIFHRDNRAGGLSGAMLKRDLFLQGSDAGGRSGKNGVPGVGEGGVSMPRYKVDMP
jgi:hypothetical protein